MKLNGKNSKILRELYVCGSAYIETHPYEVTEDGLLQCAVGIRTNVEYIQNNH